MPPIKRRTALSGKDLAASIATVSGGKKEPYARGKAGVRNGVLRSSRKVVSELLMKRCIAPVLLGCALFFGCSPGRNAAKGPVPLSEPAQLPANARVAYFAGGCFWCTEEIFHQQPGVISVVSGYMGGTEPNPSYEKVSAGTTGYAEAIRVAYDPERTTYDKMLEAFWHAHDPTELNRQGPDAGPQYRSAIFYTDEKERKEAEGSKAQLARSGGYSRPIVTEISKAGTFHIAEDYHQNYYRNHPNDRYLQQWLLPKLKKLGLKHY